MSNGSGFLTPVAVARLLGVRDSKVFKWCREGAIKAINLSEKPGGLPRYRITQAALDAFLEARTVRPATKPTTSKRAATPANYRKYY